MKIIHTSDWHLGQKLYNYDRTDEEVDFFRQLKEIVARERPDALLVSGDVFDSGAPGNDVAKGFTDGLLSVTAACPEMETIVIAGNHDSYSRLVVDASLWQRCRVHVVGRPAEDRETGRAEFDRNIIEIPGKGLVVAVPFCHPRNFPSVEDPISPDRQKAYFAALRRHVDARAAGLPIVLMAHLAVGSETSLLGHFRGSVVGGEERVPASDLGAGYDYVALGHIHHPQWVTGTDERTRYCGTPRQVNFDEAYGHGVDVVEVAAGEKPVLRTEKIHAKRRLVTVGGAEGVPFDEALALFEADERFRPETYVRLKVALGAKENPDPSWTDRARAAVAARGGRFCLVNLVRAEAEEDPASNARRYTVDEIRDMDDDAVIEIVKTRCPLTETQINLLREVLKETGA